MFIDNPQVQSLFKEVSVPYCAKSYVDCLCRAYQCRSHLFPELFVIQYKSMVDNFVVVCINRDNHMFGAMKGMWKEITKRFGIAIDDYDMLMKVKSSKDAINKLKYELKNKGLEKDITEARKQMEELRESLFDMENSMTKLYEDAAEAMNFLEEHGYPQEELTQ